MSYEVNEMRVIFCFKMIRIWKIKDVVVLADFIVHVHANTGMRLCASSG